jgi:hypothetical protein
MYSLSTLACTSFIFLTSSLELFAERHAYMSRRGGRVEPLRDEYPQVYKMPFILEYEKWPTLAQRDYGSGGGL